MEDCTHQDTYNGVCKICGLCIEDTDYVSSYTPCRFIIPTKFKYFVINRIGRYERCAESLLGILNVSEYSEQVKQLLKSKEFVRRINPNSKVLGAIYYVLKMNDYPISYHDLQPYMLQHMIYVKRVVLKDFEYINMSIEYLTAIFNRTKEFYCRGRTQNDLKQQEAFKDSDLDGFIRICTRNRRTNPYLLCMAYFIRNKSIQTSYNQFGLKVLIEITQLRAIVKTVKNIIKAESLEDLTDVKIRRKFIKKNAKEYFMNWILRKR
ncbi:hypothetical protein CWI42_041800 [Ordospora colligata]|uniref:Uncharacterized protein n=1 Tax=Ordospora colligata OC4 TaxID=1354746 RepID=A0A0B2UKT9_9MICR|nr:uncharacterized protein M896_041810 [Ordospora colligata OC4]KHN69983.1 hypothetical protein M896_041810 [Ordospora colligata OC4]TBU16153.1 hypothetical protein CWI41_041800 [Ordospora colligata]TBU16366.1 hypothetical protein CWI40_041800 [Ordospora colligata]TBU19070.1 hypothetical protein CWI42_041800 [Ordospora colligata]